MSRDKQEKQKLNVLEENKGLYAKVLGFILMMFGILASLSILGISLSGNIKSYRGF